MGSYLVGARHTVRMADPASVRESEMSPLLQTIPPRQSETYADGHDESMWRAGSSNVLGILGGLPVHVAEEASRGDHTLHGSVGRGSQRPRVSGRVVFSKQAAAPEWVRCQARLDPVAGGVEPSPTCSSELGEWQHGWQYHGRLLPNTTSEKPLYLPSRLPQTELEFACGTERQ